MSDIRATLAIVVYGLGSYALGGIAMHFIMK